MKEQKYYVYLFLDPTKFGPFKYSDFNCKSEPFYVGKGSSKRWKFHFHKMAMKRDSNRKKVEKIKDLLNTGYKKEDLVLIIEKNLSEENSFELEQLLISKIGRMDYFSGPLLNMTNGGDGSSNPSEETRRKMTESRKGLLAGNKNPMFGMKGKLHPNWGIPSSEETKQKMKDNHSDFRKEKHPMWGLSHKQESRDKMSNSHSVYEYRLISPKGEEFFTKSMNKFCDEHDCVSSSMSDVVNGKYFQHKGWTGNIVGKEYLRDKFLKNVPKRIGINFHYLICSPDGIMYDNVINLTLFCKEHHLNYPLMKRALKNDILHKGWKISKELYE
jgi:LEM3-like protein/NUMOD3 motif-containing protein